MPATSINMPETDATCPVMCGEAHLPRAGLAERSRSTTCNCLNFNAP